MNTAAVTGGARRVGAVIGAVCVSGALSVLPGLAMSGPLETPPWGSLALFAVLTMTLQHLAVDVGNQRGKVSVAVVPVLGASFLYGEIGVLTTAAAYALWAEVTARSPLHRLLFNLGMVLLAAQGATWVFRLLVGQPVGDAPFARLVLPAVVAGLLYYTINHALLCTVRGLAEGRSPGRVWRADYAWLAPHYAVLGALGLVVAAGYEAFGWTGVLALMAPVAMMHLAIRQYVERAAAHVEELQSVNRQVRDSHDATLLALTRALDTRDQETEEHSHRVRRYTEMIARQCGLPPEEIEDIARGALLHDLGKIGVPDAVLRKRGSLSAEEWAIMRGHPALGHAMLAHIPFLSTAAEVVLHHHEAYDGSGYPHGLAGAAIPLGARLFAVADALDAITSDRTYGQALPYATALTEIRRCRGTQFDPRAVDALLAIPESLLLSVRGEHRVTGDAHPVGVA